ncbi:uncharacterized protein rps6kl1 isoform X2 [Myripristis murdjan]|uniref:uncharacterized protein rps6kl1 isoform X2 n=1 Tax=Myripristis murdjan TaxID=586833 RepID=UPI0011760234|nr:ribosomal protein S6 kinase-like 1 isoform X2 [Myripristis murdjan]
MAKRDYLVEAAKQIRMALDREVNEDYEAAFSYYKNGVDLLLNGVQLDPNKDRREAVKRKTAQYLKRAEEIFISHLQDNLGKGSSHLGGYSSLRFRPIRHLSSPVEDLEMCKVVGVIDKVLIVQSMVNKETFVVKSLAKSSWESRDKPTIIPQGVPYMVKLLRYYVSEDAVYLHLEHVQGGRLFSKLHKVRSDKAKEHPECFSPGQHRIKLRTSYTSPTISTDYQHKDRECTSMIPPPERINDESPDTDSPTSWAETQQRMESCGTHSYIEETGCLQNMRASAVSFYTRLERPALFSGPMRTHISTHIHPPAPSLCLHTSETQEKPALPLSCARVSHALDVMSQLHEKTAGMGLIECSSDFEDAWKAADPAHNCESINPYAVTGTNLHSTVGKTVPHTSQTSLGAADSANVKNNGMSSGSSPAILHLPLHCQTQIRGRASWTTNGSHHGSVFSGFFESTTDMVTDLAKQSTAEEQDNTSPTAEERKAMLVIRSTDRAVFSGLTDIRTTSESSQTSCASLYHSAAGEPATHPGVSMTSRMKNQRESLSGKPGEGVEEALDLLNPGEKKAHAKEGPLCDPYPSGPPGAPSNNRTGYTDALLKSGGSGGPEEDQIIEVDGWCHLPRFPVKSSRTNERAMQACWGLPEAEVRVWGAQILLALENLHQQGILCRDLNPKNILLTSNEIGGVSKITEACDWWSLGALLFELLTGMPLWQLHPAGIHSHTQLLIPDHLSTAAASLLTELLQFDAGYRLGSGGGGVSDIKCHPFFSGVSWKALSC